MSRRHGWGKRLANALLVVLAMLAGCSALGGKKVASNGTPASFDKARLSYRIETDRLNGSRRKEAGSKLASFHQAPLHPLPVGAYAMLEVYYPHPDRKAGLAQVRVRIENQQPKSGSKLLSWWSKAKEELPRLAGSAGWQETWVVDIPQSELKQLVNALGEAGYFYAFAPPHDATLVETELDGTRLTKKWTQVPELDALVHRARTEGRLASSTKVAGTTPLDDPAMSASAYRQLLAQEQGTAVATDLPPANSGPADRAAAGPAAALVSADTTLAPPPVPGLANPHIVRLPAVNRPLQ